MTKKIINKELRILLAELSNRRNWKDISCVCKKDSGQLWVGTTNINTLISKLEFYLSNNGDHQC